MSNRLKAFIIFSFLLQACNQSGGGGGGGEPVAGSPKPGDNNVCSASLDESSYFEDVATPSQVSYANDDSLNALRLRTVKVNANALKNDLKAGKGLLRLDLFGDRNYTVIAERIQKFSDDNYVLTGRIDGEPLSSVSLSVNSDVIVAQVNTSGDTRYDVMYNGDGTHSIHEMATDEDEEEASCLAVAPPMEAAHDEIADTEPVQNAVAATPVIDMLVAYTPSAKSAMGGEAAVKALIQTGIANTNKAFVDSGVNLSVRLVGIMAVKQNETGNWSGNLSSLAGKTDGLWDEVHAERARLGADQVSLVASYSGSSTAGIGYIKSTASSAFTITRTSAFSQFSFTHELGHNVGLNHTDGYVNSSGGFRTIMAYGSVTRIGRFSNPSLPYKNYATGTSSQNSAKILNANGTTTSKLVAAVVPTTSNPTDVPVVPNPSNPSNPSSPNDPTCP